MQQRVRWIAMGTLLCAGAALADSWMPPSTEIHVSADGAWKLTVEPRPITSPLAYFEDKVADRNNPGGPAGSRQTGAIGVMEQRVGRTWQVRWKMPLLNETAPVQALALPGGQAATFDNWHSMGYGKDAVVIYDASGKPLASHALTDFLPREYVRALPRSVSSIHWRGTPTLSRDGMQLLVPVVVPSVDARGISSEKTRYIDARFDLATGAFVPMAGNAWTRALASAEGVRKQQRIEEEAARTRFLSPLRQPATNEVREWYGYLTDAYYRLDGNEEGEYPATNVLDASTKQDADRSLGSLRDSLHELAEDGGVLMVGSSAGQQALVDALLREALELPAKANADSQLYIALDDAHFVKVAGVLRGTFPRVAQVDITKPIPQSQARIDRYLKATAEAEE